MERVTAINGEGDRSKRLNIGIGHEPTPDPHIANIEEVPFLCVVEFEVRRVHRSKLLLCDYALINNDVVYQTPHSSGAAVKT